jgi:hypothetical protein
LRSIEYDVTGAHARWPSGDSVGVPMRFTAHRASASNGAFAALELARLVGIGELLRVE